jgi:hypothetical protein
MECASPAGDIETSDSGPAAAAVGRIVDCIELICISLLASTLRATISVGPSGDTPMNLPNPMISRSTHSNRISTWITGISLANVLHLEATGWYDLGVSVVPS